MVACAVQVFTNDAFYASNHRVLKSVSSERYSRAYFFNPSFKADIAPSPGLTSLAAGVWCGDQMHQQ
jgi:isopenicillin N synthase-like dioxygenase